MYENYNAETRTRVRIRERLRSRVVRARTHTSGLKLDLNVSRVNALVEDRQRKLVFGFVKFVSTYKLCEYLESGRSFVRLTWELAS